MPRTPKGVRLGGRSKGTPNKDTILKTLALHEALMRRGFDVFDEMVTAMNTGDLYRFEALIKLLPYMLPRLSQQVLELGSSTDKNDGHEELDALPAAQRIMLLKNVTKCGSDN